MKLKFFWIPAWDTATAENELNTFLSAHRVLHIEKFFHEEEGKAGWSIAVEYLLMEGQATKSPSKTRPIDYREILDPETFEIFAALRAWRKTTAVNEGIPPYSVATNEQLAGIARERLTTVAGLEKLPGFGKSRLTKYGETILGQSRSAISKLAPSSAAAS